MRTNRLLLLVFILPLLTSLLAAQTAADLQARAHLPELAASLQSELEVHGNRVLGHDMYIWTTRFSRLTGCYIELAVTIANNRDDHKVTSETVNFSLGALDPAGMVVEKNWVTIPCAAPQKCVQTRSVCQVKTRDGFDIDCTTPSTREESAFHIHYDGKPEGAERIRDIFHQATDICRKPFSVSF